MQHFFIGSIDLIEVIYLFTVETLYLDVITSNCTLNHHTTNTQIAEYNPGGGNWVMKSTETKDQGVFVIGRGCNRPYCLWGQVLLRMHVSHDLT